MCVTEFGYFLILSHYIGLYILSHYIEHYLVISYWALSCDIILSTSLLLSCDTILWYHLEHQSVTILSTLLGSHFCSILVSLTIKTIELNPSLGTKKFKLFFTPSCSFIYLRKNFFNMLLQGEHQIAGHWLCNLISVCQFSSIGAFSWGPKKKIGTQISGATLL